MSQEVMEIFLSHSWPGNVRELINVLQYASIGCQGQEIGRKHLSAELQAAQVETLVVGDSGEVPAGSLRSGPGRKNKLDNRRVAAALEKSGGNRAEAARLLGVGRATLYRFLARR